MLNQFTSFTKVPRAFFIFLVFLHCVTAKSIDDVCAWYNDLNKICDSAAAKIEGRDKNIFCEVHANRPLRVYIGSSRCKSFPGYINTIQEEFDVTKAEDYARLFCKESVDSFLTEHTFEHIPYGPGKDAFRLMSQYLKPGGLLRIAVPNDGRAGQTIGNSQTDSLYGHVAGYNFEYLKKTLLDAGFSRVRLLEEKRDLNLTHAVIETRAWDRCEGPVDRTVKYDWRNKRAMELIYGKAALDSHLQLGDNTIVFNKDTNEAEITRHDATGAVTRYRMEGSSVESLIDNVPYSGGMSEECKARTKHNLKSLNKKVVGIPPIASLLVDAFK